MYRYPVHIMNTLELSYTDARANFARLWDQIIEDQRTAIIHRRGKEDVAMLPASELTGLMETAHLLRSPANAKRLFEALQGALDGTGIPMTLDELKKHVGLE